MVKNITVEQLKESTDDLLPKYYRLQQLFKQQIISGEFGGKLRFPSEREIKRKYKVSMSTVRKSLSGLAVEGLVTRIHGKGTFVNRESLLKKYKNKNYSAIVSNNIKVKQQYNTFAIGIIAATGILNRYSLSPAWATPRIISGFETMVQESGGTTVYFDKLSLFLKEFQIRKDKFNIKYVLYVPSVDYVQQIEDEIRLLRKSGIDFVVVDHNTSQPVDTVRSDSVLGGYLAAEHLIELGHKKIVFLCSEQFSDINYFWISERIQGFKDALNFHGISFEETDIFTANAEAGDDYWLNVGIRAGEEIIKMKTYTAIICVNDQTAIGVMQTAEKMKIKIPEEISIVGNDNDWFQYGKYNLTTVDNRAEEVGHIAADILLDKVNGANTKEIKQVRLKPNLIVRGSTASPKYA